MSQITNYVKVFPGRCREVLTEYKAQDKSNKRNVTSLLMAASAGITVPYERLQKPDFQPIQDHTSNPSAANALGALLQKQFFGSDLWINQPPAETSWKGGVLECLMQAKNVDHKPLEQWTRPERWPELNNPASLEASVPVCYVVECLRNALAHGNIYTIAGTSTLNTSDSDRAIEQIVFATGTGTGHRDRLQGCWCKQDGKGSPFRFIQVSVTDFEVFLTNWFAWLGRLSLDPRFEEVQFTPEQEA